MTCITDTAYTQAAGRQAEAIRSQAKTDVAIQTALALWQRKSSKSITNMQTEIADEQVKLAEQLHAHAKLFWPEQIELVNDVFSITKLENDYVALPLAWGGILNETLAEGRADWLEAQQRNMCSTPSHCEDARWDRNTALMQADMMSYAARQGEARVQVLNDWRYELQVDVLSLGKGVARTMASYEALRGRSMVSSGQLLASGIETALGGLGYWQSRRLNSGWGAGIRGTFESVYAPAPTPHVQGQQVTTHGLTPVSPVVTEPLPAEVSKANEIEAGVQEYLNSEAFQRGRYN